MNNEIPRFIARAISVGAGKKIVKTGFLHNKTKETEAPLLSDTDSLCQKLVAAYTELDALGYDVVNVVPIIEGTEVSVAKQEHVISVTRSAVVVGRLRDIQNSSDNA